MKRRQFAIVIISTGLLALTYIYFIIPNQGELQTLRYVEAGLAQQVDVARQRIMQQGLMAKQNQQPNIDNSIHFLTDISMLSQINRLNLLSIASLQEKNKIKMQLTGNYTDMLMFMTALSNQAHLLSVSDFAIKPLKSSDLQLAIDLTLVNPSGKFLIVQPPRTIITKNVFCSADSLRVHTLESEFIFTVQQIKMVGYMNVSGSASAFIELPDRTEHQVEYGSIIGLERAHVIAILDDQIKLKSPDGKIHIIVMQRFS